MAIQDFATRSEYVQFHKRITRERGKASLLFCDCGKQARDWSHIHGTEVRDVENYVAKCRSCHKKYDFTEEIRQRLIEVNTGHHRPGQFGNQHRLGKPHSQESLAKMSVAKKGKPWSEARRKAYEDRWCANV